MTDQRQKAAAWVQGYLFGYYLERGYGVLDALEKAGWDVPEHLEESVPFWNPYDPCTTDPDAD